MAIDKIQSESINLADNFAFTGTVTGAGGANTPYFEAYQSSAQSGISSGTTTKITFNTERFDTAGNYDHSTNYRFTPQTAGKYFVYAGATIGTDGGYDAYSFQLHIYKNGSSYVKQADLVNPSYSISTKSLNIFANIDFNGSSDYVEIFARTVAGSTVYIDAGLTTGSFGAYKIIE